MIDRDDDRACRSLDLVGERHNPGGLGQADGDRIDVKARRHIVQRRDVCKAEPVFCGFEHLGQDRAGAAAHIDNARFLYLREIVEATQGEMSAEPAGRPFLSKQLALAAKPADSGLPSALVAHGRNIRVEGEIECATPDRAGVRWWSQGRDAGGGENQQRHSGNERLETGRGGKRSRQITHLVLIGVAFSRRRFA